MSDMVALEAAALVRAAGEPTTAQLEAIRRRMADHTFDESKLFVWSAALAGNGVRRDHVQLQQAALNSIARDCRAGVAFQAQEHLRELPLGQSFSGEYISGRVTAGIYTILGVRTGSIASSDFATAVRAGIVKKVTLAFSRLEARCSVCRRDPLATNEGMCLHIPGVKYDDDGKIARHGKTAILEITDCALSAICAASDSPDPAATLLARHERSGRLSGEELARARLAVLLARRPQQPAPGGSEAPGERRPAGRMPAWMQHLYAVGPR